MVVLKEVPSVLSPELLFAHGDELVLADANFPASSICACGPKEIRANGGMPQLLAAIPKLLPLDACVSSPSPLEKVERFAFHEQAKKAYVVVAEGETAPYGNVTLKKGVLLPTELELMGF
ncbi:LOW QUALITY PROTEIN: fucose mutarotase [Spinachia spinachia]